jgi:hypothetical protein
VKSQRIEPTISSEDERRRDGILRAAWNKIPDGFPAKPFPKSSWYEAASGDSTPWKKTITPIRCAILAAVLSGDKKLIAETLEGARAFCRELEADFTSLVPAEGEESIVTLALEETQLEGPANAIEMALVENPTPIEAERAIAPLSRHSAALAELVERCRKLARQPQSLEVRRAAFYTPRTNKLFATQ